jgi:hypothetical protein
VPSGPRATFARALANQCSVLRVVVPGGPGSETAGAHLYLIEGFAVSYHLHVTLWSTRPAVRIIWRWTVECIHWLTMPAGVPKGPALRSGALRGEVAEAVLLANLVEQREHLLLTGWPCR